MNCKKACALVSAAVLALSLAACGGPKAPEALKLREEAYLLRAPGDRLELSGEVVIEDEKASQEVVFSADSSDVITVSPEGTVTANAPGSSRVTVASAADENVKTSAEVLVYDFSGIYTTEKYIDAMGCNVRVNLEILPDGTYRFYRYPMNVALEGGGLMEGFTDPGTYTAEGGGIHFVGDYFKDFRLKLSLDANDNALLSGKTPTGGASTDMEFVRNTREDRGESGTYMGKAESAEGQEISLTLTMAKGHFTLTADGAVISDGIYSFNGNETEFWADPGVSFRASYDGARQVVEGIEIPVSTELEAAPVAATLERQ